MKTSYRDICAYITRDGSEIRELMHPAIHGNRQQSLAEAIIQPGQQTQLHRHLCSEELYHVTRGAGIMTLADAMFAIGVGDTILIPPETPHRVTATGGESLHLLCCCCPPYRHDDTELM